MLGIDLVPQVIMENFLFHVWVRMMLNGQFQLHLQYTINN